MSKEQQTQHQMSPDCARSAAVLDALAWGVERKQHLPDVLRSLPMYTGVLGPFPGLFSPLKPFIRLLFWPAAPLWFLPLLIIGVVVSRMLGAGMFVAYIAILPLVILPLLVPIGRLRWSWNLTNLCTDLEAGRPLGEALEANLRRHYPGYVFAAISQAEEAGILESALPRLAEKIRYQREVAKSRSLPMNYTMIKILATAYVMVFISIVIMPKFEEIFKDVLGPDAVLPFVTQLMMGSSRSLFLLLIILLLCAFFTVLMCTRIPIVGPWIAGKVPFLKRDQHRQELAEASGSMATFLEQGLSMEEAADASFASTRNHNLFTKMNMFADKVREGVPWRDAWSQAGLGTEAEQWVLKNAEIREQPAAAFRQLQAWAKDDIDRVSRLLFRWLDPLTTVLFGAIIAAIVLGMFLPLIELVKSLSNAV